MIIQLLNKIPIKIYLYIIIFAIVIFGIIGVYMFLKMSLSSFQKTIVIWYFIILEKKGAKQFNNKDIALQQLFWGEERIIEVQTRAVVKAYMLIKYKV